MTPQQQIKAVVVAMAIKDAFAFSVEPDLLTPDGIEEAYDELVESNRDNEYLNEIREGKVETNIERPYSRHYESQSVAAKCPDGRWIGWTYWYGGGKHGCPEEIEWINGAYYLECKEEEKLVVIRTFSKIECPAT